MDLLLKVGLTGGIASGKTIVATLFSELGVPIIDADQIAHALVQQGEPALMLIAEIFGCEIINDDGSLNRIQLRQRVFSDVKQRKRLEEILHPRVVQTMWEKAAQLTSAYCIFSVPLLVETQLVKEMDRILVVDCSPEIQKQRLINYRKLSPIEAEQMLAAQVKREDRLVVADDILLNENEGEIGALKQQVEILHQRYLQDAVLQ